VVTTANELCVRFHGVKQWDRHNYSAEELAVWAGRIKASGAGRIWAYFNQRPRWLLHKERARIAATARIQAKGLNRTHSARAQLTRILSDPEGGGGFAAGFDRR